MFAILRPSILGVNKSEMKANCGTYATYRNNRSPHSSSLIQTFHLKKFIFLCGMGRGEDSQSTSISSRLHDPPGTSCKLNYRRTYFLHEDSWANKESTPGPVYWAHRAKILNLHALPFTETKMKVTATVNLRKVTDPVHNASFFVGHDCNTTVYRPLRVETNNNSKYPIYHTTKSNQHKIMWPMHWFLLKQKWLSVANIAPSSLILT
jgi:hypothetical protein